MPLDMSAIHVEQVTLNSLVQNILYASGIVGAILVVVGLLLIDAGTARRRNLFNSTIEKTLGFFLGFATYYFIGFGLWAGQYYIMEGATMMDSINDWWLGGAMTNALAHHTDPVAHLPDHRQVVTDEQHRQPEFLLQVFQQVQDLRLNRNVQR